MRPVTPSVRLLPMAMIAVLTVAACSSDAIKPNTTPPDFMGLGSGSAGDASVSRVGGNDSGTIFGIGKGPKDNNQGVAGGGAGTGIGGERLPLARRA